LGGKKFQETKVQRQRVRRSGRRDRNGDASAAAYAESGARTVRSWSQLEQTAAAGKRLVFPIFGQNDGWLVFGNERETISRLN